eukprot:g42058.t1
MNAATCWTVNQMVFISRGLEYESKDVLLRLYKALVRSFRMKYDVGNCEVMSFGKKNRGVDYFLNGEKIQKSEVQRDMGVLVQDSLK